MTGSLYTAAETAAIREKVINNYALPIVKRVFDKYLQIQSAYFAIAQYWDDNASDQVHNFILFLSWILLIGMHMPQQKKSKKIIG